MKRQFVNAMMESNKSPVMFEKYADRKPFHEQAPKWGGKDGPCESRFESFNTISGVNSKYSTKEYNQIALFVNQLPRINEKTEKKKNDDN